MSDPSLTPYGQQLAAQIAAGGAWGAPGEVISAEALRERDIAHRVREHEISAEARRRYLGLTHLPPSQNDILTEQLKVPVPDVPWLIGSDDSGLARAGHTILLVSRYKTGKTTLLSHLGKSLCDSTPFLGEYPAHLPPGKRIGYMDFEMEFDDTRSYLMEAGVQNTDLIAYRNLKGYSIPFASDPSAREWVTWWLQAHAIGIWVIDTITEVASHHKISLRSDEIGTVLHAINEIAAAAGVQNVIIASHIPHGVEEGFERAYGDQSISAWTDVIWTLSKDGPASDAPRLFGAYGRRVPDLEPRVIELGTSGLVLTDMIRGEGAFSVIKDAVLNAVIANQMSANGHGPMPLTTAQVRERVKKDRSQVADALKELQESGLVKNLGTGMPGPGSTNWVPAGSTGAGGWMPPAPLM